MLGTTELEELCTLVTLDESAHKYSIKDDPRDTFISASTCISSTFPKFDADKMASYIVKSRNFGTGSYASFKNSLNPVKSIKTEWERIGLEARNMGIQLHLDIENYYNSNGKKKPKSIVDDEVFQQFLTFDKNVRRAQNWTPYISELKIRDLDFALCGTIDMLFKSEDGELIMIDWKRSKKNFQESFDFGLGPLHNVAASQLNKYSLQQNIYKYIFNKEKNLYSTVCSRKIVEMYLLQMHDTLSHYKLWPVVNFDESVIEKCLLYSIDNK